MIEKVALRNCFLQRKRYALLLFAIALGFSLVTLTSGASKALLDSMKDKASRYFAGHVSVVGFRDYKQMITDADAIIAQISDMNLGIRTIAKRVVYYRPDAKLLFGGESVKQRRLVGIDFNLEANEFSKLSYASGGYEAMKAGGGILISEKVSTLLGARIGDDINILATSDQGQYTSAQLVVRGIFRESSLFGYVSYVSLDDMNSLYGRPSGSVTEIALFIDNQGAIESIASSIRAMLANKYPTFPYYATKDELYSHLNEAAYAEKLGVMSLDAYLTQFKQLLDMILYVTYIILAVFILIVAVAIMNTYRVLVNERIREIGTMRAIGLSKQGLLRLFFVEAFVLIAAGSILGFVAGAIFMALVGIPDLSGLPGAGLFLDSGHIRFTIDFYAGGVNALIMAGVALFAVSGPVRRASKLTPAQALRED